MKKLLLVAALVIGLIAAVPVAAQAEEAPKKIGISMYTQRTEFYMAMSSTVEKLCKERGWECTTLSADMDLTKEMENMEALVTQGVDLIFMEPLQIEGSAAAAQLAVDAGIPVICFDSAIDPSVPAVTNVYADNFANGVLVGKWVADEYFKDKEIHAIVMHGVAGLEPCVQRARGVIAGLLAARAGLSDEEAAELAIEVDDEAVNNGSAYNEAANLYIDASGYDEGLTDTALQLTEDFLNANHDVNLIIANNDDAGYGSIQAVENLGLEDQIICVGAADARKGTLDGMMNDPDYLYKAIGLNIPAKVAETAFGIAEQILVDGADPTSFDWVTNTEAVCINAANAEEFYDPDALF